MDLILTRYIPYVPQWSNLMGAYVDNTSSRSFNSPVKGYFSIVKNITPNGKRNVRPTEYIRLSKEYSRQNQGSYIKLQCKRQRKIYKKYKCNERRAMEKNTEEDKAKLNKTMVHG